MILFKAFKLGLTLCLCLNLASSYADTKLPDLEADLDEQSLSNPSYIVGQHWFRKLHGSKRLIHFPPAYDYLRNALAKLLPHTELYQKNIEIGLLNSAQNNAFVLPGSHLFLYSGMLSRIKNEQTLFALLAHELAHLDLKHYERQNQQNKQEQSKALLMIGAGIAAALAGADGEASSALLLSGIANKAENNLAYSRIQEQEADRQARKYLIQADLDQNATSELFLTFFQASIGREPIEFLSTHPIPETRLSDSINTEPAKSILKQGDQTDFNQFRASMLGYRASLLLEPNSYLNSQITNENELNYAKALSAYLSNQTLEALALSPLLDETFVNQAYLKALILIRNQKLEDAAQVINKKLEINEGHLAFIELSPSKTAISKLSPTNPKLLQYEQDIINRIHLSQARKHKNLALTWAYEAQIAFSNGKTKAALKLLDKAKPEANKEELKVIKEITTQIKHTVDLENTYDLTQS
ncbi:quinolinate synthetase [Marinomonas sp. MED121]|uniref:M48 family metallopeptidase n=1 Tax=Marinomonas sp. MED121 TaxID=314277 RepID=UPI000068FFDF|nr:M48 family metalloprotease [Marinomonas sp. MED121]EAQ66606.1 quinolinate synthetase [Marinomonas sp. MED121]